MKKLLFIALPIMLLTLSCKKTDLAQPPINESEWLTMPAGRVVENGNFSCGYFIVENQWGYSLMRSVGATPFRGSIVYGPLNRWGFSNFYNRSGRYIFGADVVDYGMSYFQALDQLNWYCRDPFEQ